MREIIDRIKNADTRVQLVGLAVIVLIVIFIGFNRFDSRDIGLGDDSLPGEIKDGLNNINFPNGKEPEIPNLNNGKRIRVALLAGSFYDVDFGGKKRGCDSVVMVEHSIKETPAVLNGSLEALFREDIQTDFLPGNFIASQDKLKFKEARIENGTAKVYLEGEMGPIAGDCDNDRVKIQIEETALQFNSVKSVEVYLNGNRI